MLSETLREGITYEFFSGYHLPLSHLPLLAFPLLFGAGPTAFAGTAFEVSPYVGAFNLHELTGWIGIAPVILALAGFLISRKSRRRHVSWAWMSIGALSFILCLGPVTPLNRLMFEAPVYNMFKGPAKNWISVHLAISVLAGIGIHRLLILCARKRLAFGVTGMILSTGCLTLGLQMLGFIFWAKFCSQPWPDTAIANLSEVVSFRSPAIWMPLAAVFANSALLLCWALTRKIIFPVLMVLTIVPHAAFLKQSMHIICVDMSAIYSEPEKNDVYTFLKNRETNLDDYRIYPVRLSISDGANETLYPSINSVYGVRSLAGYGPLFPKALAELTGIHSIGLIGNLEWHLSNSRILSMLNVKYLTVLRWGDHYNGIISALDGTPENPSPYRLAFTSRSTVRVYENPSALPRAYSVANLICIGQGQDAERDRLDAIRYVVDEKAPFTPGHDAVFEGPLPKGFPTEFTPASVVASSEGPNKIRASIDIQGDGQAFVVFCETFYPGWQAIVDGEVSEIYRVNGLCIGVLAPEGTKEILLRYRPRAFLVGAAISFVMLLALIPDYFLPRKRAPRP